MTNIQLIVIAATLCCMAAMLSPTVQSKGLKQANIFFWFICAVALVGGHYGFV
jgi:hypothetical protein